MDIVLDTCTLINLINGKILDKAVSLPGHSFFLGEMVLDQEMLNVSQKETLLTEIANGRITVLESNVTISKFNELRNSYNLGTGETECLVLCKNLCYCIATDDKRARECSKIEIGNDHVVGSLFLLKECIKCKFITCIQAIQILTLMRVKGGFLPKLDEKYFCP